MVEVNYALIGANGDRIDFDNSNYVMNPDFAGFNMAPAQVRIEQSAGDGGVFRHSKKGVRDLDLAVTTIGANREEVQTKLRRLSRLLQDVLGPTQLIATYSNGEVLQMTVYYVGGAEGQWNGNAGQVWNRWVLSFQAPMPYWEKATELSFVFGSNETGRGLLPQLTKLKVSSNTVLGQVTINNVGDVPSYPKWVIMGPVTNLLISNGTQSFSFPDEIAEGEIITVETATGKVYDEDGNNVYSLLGSAPKLFPITPGSRTYTVTGDNATGATSVGMFYRPRYEVVH